MDKLDIIIWVMGTGFTFMFCLMAFMWTSLNKRFDLVDKRIDRLDQRIDKLDEKVTDIDRRICRMEGAFSNKDCCMLNDHGQSKRVE